MPQLQFGRLRATQNLAALAILAACCTLHLPLRLAAQNPMAGHVMQTRDEIPPDQLPPPQKLDGIGNAHIKISATPEAQAWFDQGLNLFHDFWDYESVRAFQQGVRVDPNCAMCSWGIYHAELFTHSNAKYYAKQALAKAVAMKKHVSEAERLYIEAAEKSEKKPRSSGEVKTWRKLVKKYPTDLQARIFLSQAVSDGYDDNGQPSPGQKEALSILQAVLKEDPDNSAANHYWIHAVEASPHPEQALHSAQILGRLAPSSGHMVHMPGHIFYRTGDYTSAQKSFSASTDADEHYMDSQHVQVDDDWNYVHNLMYSIANLLEAGQLEAASTLSARLNRAHGELANSLYPWSARDSISRIEPHLPVALRAGDWQTASQLLSSASVPDALPNIQFLQRELKSFVAGMNALDQQSLADAEKASADFDAKLKKTSGRVSDDEKKNKKQKKPNADATPPKLPVLPDAYARPLLKNLSVMSLELRAAVLVQKKKNDDAKKLFAQAAKEEKDLGYREPPAYIRPVGETEAAAFLAASDWAAAKSAYQAALTERPNSGFPLYGLALVAEKSGDSTAAAKAYSDFLTAWRSADAALPQLTHAKEYVAAHTTTAAN